MGAESPDEAATTCWQAEGPVFEDRAEGRDCKGLPLPVALKRISAPALLFYESAVL
jgi:hypothetical protein